MRRDEIALTDDAPDSYFSELMQAPSVRLGRGGHSNRGSVRELRKKLLNKWCWGCGSRRASDETVCQRCGTIIGEVKYGPPRFARIPPEYAALLHDSPGLRLRDIINFVTKTARWRNGDLDEWVQAFAEGKQCREQRRSGDRGGRPRGFGTAPGVKVQDRLPMWLDVKFKTGRCDLHTGEPTGILARRF